MHGAIEVALRVAVVKLGEQQVAPYGLHDIAPFACNLRGSPLSP
jgi:hypothetical protein